MDFRFNSCGFWLFLQTLLTVITVISAKDCRLCKPGYYASRHCTELHDTVCKPCSKGTFSPKANVFKTCSQCSKCELGEFVYKPCSKHSDTVCESCSAITDIATVTERFLKDCLQFQRDEPGQNSENTDENGVKLQNIEDTASDRGKASVIYEGSGETRVDVSYTDKNIPEEEGSGVIPVIDETEKNITDVILPDETDVTEIEVSSTTKKSGIIQIDDGIKLPNDTDKQKTNVVIGVTFPTTRKNIFGNGQGIVVKDPQQGGTTVESVDVYIEDIQEDITPDYGYEHRPPQSGASKGKETKSGGTSIGVVVTVGLVAALVFFILGFLASKLWNGRRERTFNVLEAERLNGKANVENKGIEYKDPENRPGNKASIYDEIPANTKLNGNTADPEKGADAVYSKPVKRETAQPTSAAPPVENGNTDRKEGEWAGFTLSRSASSGSLILQPRPQRPGSEIQYMDEVEDAETDRLLQPAATGSSDAKTAPSPSSDKKGEAKLEKDTEKTPMLSNGQENENS